MANTTYKLPIRCLIFAVMLFGLIFIQAHSAEAIRVIKASSTFSIDTVSAVLIYSPTHTSPAKWYANSTVKFTWYPLVEGIIGYYVILNENQPVPPTPENAQDYIIGTEKTYQDISDGEWVFNIRGEFKDGTLTDFNSYSVKIDTTNPQVTSKSHPDREGWYQNREVSLNWNIRDISSATAFYYILDDKPDTFPDKSKATETGDTSLTITLPSDDEWFFHLVWEDEQGNLSEPATYRLGVDITSSEPVTQLKLSFTEEEDVKLNWEKPQDNESGVASYQVYRSRFKGAIGIQIGTDTEDTEFLDKTSEKGQIYFYIVMPVDRADNKQVEGNFQVSTEDALVEGALSIQPQSGHIGDEIQVGGSGFKAGEQVKVKIGAEEMPVKAGDDGSLTAQLAIPTLPGGKHVLTAEGDSGQKFEGTLEVQSRLKEIAPGKAPVGSVITVTGDGFAPNAKAAVMLGGESTSVLRGDETNSDGELSVDIVVPGVGLGIQELEVSDGQSNVTSSIQIIEGEPTTGGRGKFIMELSEGLNMVSLPLKIDLPMNAEGFAKLLDATVVIRLNEKTKRFEPFVPELGVTNFPIEGGKGYIVNVLESKAVEIEGRAWFSAPAQDGRNREPVWAFVIAGEVGFGERVVVRNVRSSESASGLVREGRFALVLGGRRGERY